MLSHVDTSRWFGGMEGFMSKRTGVAVLGATGSVGQRFIQLLEHHPLFEVTTVVASERNTGRRYRDAVRWMLPTPIPADVADLELRPLGTAVDCPVVFSSLDSSVAGDAEREYANRGHRVVSNAKNHRMESDVPLLIPEVNPDHLSILKSQKFGGGSIVTNPNCSTIGLALALKPIADAFGLRQINVVTLQAISGAGHPGVPSLDIVDNVIPFIDGEEEKIENETRKIFGEVTEKGIAGARFEVSAQCNRVPVLDGHVESVQIRLKNRAAASDLIEAWRNFRGRPQHLKLPSAPDEPVQYLEGCSHPQPRLHRDAGRGMTVSIGRLRPCSLFDFKFTILSHNTIRGAAGGAILCGELLNAEGW